MDVLLSVKSQTSRFGSGTGNCLRNTEFAKLKIVEFAPMPRANANIATAAKPGLFASARHP
jgi:hypothetical protein